jgi:hypothetical protein
MKLASHATLDTERACARAARLMSAGSLALALAGCNVVQGFQDAGDSLFPEQSTHLATPGLRLLSGHYRELGLIAGSDLYLIARGADDDSGKLFSMRYADPVPCEIPAVGRFSGTRAERKGPPIVSYFHEDVRRGTLHFADATCTTYSLSFENARLPVAETAESVVVWAGTDLWLATPETGSQVALADGVSEVIRSVFGKRFAVRENGHLKLFDSDWKLEGTYGEGVSSTLRAGKSLFYTDNAGAHRLFERKPGSGVEEQLIAADACSLGSQGGTWVALRSPCSGGHVLLIHEPTGKSFSLAFDADPQSILPIPARNSRGLDPLSDPFWFAYLRSGDDEASANTLFVRTPSGDEHALGAHATLAQLRLIDDEKGAYGYALVEVVGEIGRYLWWNADGDTRALAENTMWRPQRLFVDADGTVGSLAVTSGDRLLVLAKDVPWQAFEYRDSTKAWTVLFHDYHAGFGRLSALSGGLDQLDSTPPDAPFEAPDLGLVAQKVVVYGTASLNDVLSGVVFFSDYDLSTRTGRLEYRNLDLRFTAKVKDGVSDYLITHDEVLYAVPFGDDAGIWLAQGK